MSEHWSPHETPQNTYGLLRIVEKADGDVLELGTKILTRLNKA